MKNKKVLGLGLLLALIAVFALVWTTFKPQTVQGSKSITIEVVNSKEESTVYELNTDAEYLQQAMDEADGLTYEGAEGDFGLMIEIVNGESAVYDKDGAYWSFYVNGEYCNYGISQQPVIDGDAFSIVYTKA